MKKGDIIIRNSFIFKDPPSEDYCIKEVQAKVCWVEEKEAGILYTTEQGGTILEQQENGTWLNPNEVGEEPYLVLHESAPSFQSQVASLSDEELRAAVESMRGERTRPVEAPKAKKASVPKFSKEETSLLALMGALSPEEQLKLKEKLGL